VPYADPEQKRQHDRDRYAAMTPDQRVLWHERRRAYYKANREAAIAYAQNWEKSNRERRRKIENRYRAANPELVAKWRTNQDREKRRACALQYLYGMTLEDWNVLFDAQGRACACCGAKTSNAKSGWNVDHDHETGRVRGIVCHRCNVTLGRVGDSLEAVKATFVQFVTYLERPPTRFRRTREDARIQRRRRLRSAR
jgi:hypothetical protein